MFTKMARISILFGLAAVTPIVRAQFAVVDVGAITQLIEQVRTLESELAVARAHLAQAQTAFVSITGTRGMERLLRGARETISRPIGRAFKA